MLKIIPAQLPHPYFTPTICDDNMVIVGYHGVNSSRYKSAYKIPVTNITSVGQHHRYDTPIYWIKLTDAIHWYTSLIPNLW